MYSRLPSSTNKQTNRYIHVLQPPFLRMILVLDVHKGRGKSLNTLRAKMALEVPPVFHIRDINTPLSDVYYRLLQHRHALYRGILLICGSSRTQAEVGG